MSNETTPAPTITEAEAGKLIEDFADACSAYAWVMAEGGKQRNAEQLHHEREAARAAVRAAMLALLAERDAAVQRAERAEKELRRIRDDLTDYPNGEGVSPYGRRWHVEQIDAFLSSSALDNAIAAPRGEKP